MAYSSKLVQSRAEIYESFRGSPSIAASFPLLLGFGLSPKRFALIQQAANNFILATLNACNDKTYEYRKDLFEFYYEDIVKLPNITPNGAFYPKRETVLEYNILQRSVVAAFRDLGVIDNFAMLQPLTVRLVNGEPVPEKVARPYATARLHSDAWVGHHGDGIAGIPLFGDVKRTGLEFFEPLDPAPDFLKKTEHYEEGLSLFRGMEQYPGKLALGNMYMFDHLCLHKTVHNGGGPRASMDFAYALAHPGSRLHVEEPSERFRYLSANDWSRIGIDWLVTVQESLAGLADRYSSGPTAGQASAPPVDIVAI